MVEIHRSGESTQQRSYGRRGHIAEAEFLGALAHFDQPVLQALAGRQCQLQVLPIAAQQPELDGDMQRFLLGLARSGRQHLRNREFGALRLGIVLELTHQLRRSGLRIPSHELLQVSA